jgi:diguanylate cyclase (GGDEF)-like protein
MLTAAELRKRSASLLVHGQGLLTQVSNDALVEFAVTLSSFSEFLHGQGLAGLSQLSRGIEENALALLDAQTDSPRPVDHTVIVQRTQELVQRVEDYLSDHQNAAPERRTHGANGAAETVVQQRVWLFGSSGSAWQELALQLGHFNIEASFHQVRSLPGHTEEPTLVLLSVAGLETPQAIEQVKQLRERFTASTLLVHQLKDDFQTLRDALNAGADHCLPQGITPTQLLGRILDLFSVQQQDPYHVLVVEDSLTASHAIQRSLALCGIQALCVSQPQQVLPALTRQPPDLILLDMYLPDCTGIEVARVIRQHPEFLSLPIVYLSSEAQIPMQVQALRHGGDHFLTKPYNPVVLNAVVQSKIERYRMLRAAMERDSLTGLYNHNTSKARLGSAIRQARNSGQPLCVAMVDIDYFKKINDSYGHPMGDQVIRNVSWFLRQHLRRSDLIGRYGGEEFLLVLPDTTLDQAARMLDRIREEFAQIRHSNQDASCSATVSAGVAALQDNDSTESLVKQADVALYNAKHQGRNRIVTAQ